MYEVFPFFKGKKVLITGHTGFKGSWLTLWLLKLGAKVLGYSLEPPTQPNLFDLLNLKKRTIHVLGDVRDFAKVLQVFQNFQPEIVFHLASQFIVSISYKQPYLTFETNIMGTLNILGAIRNTKSVNSALIITTDKCYENKEWIYGYREIDPLGGKDLYSASKTCIEHLVFSYNMC